MKIRTKEGEELDLEFWSFFKLYFMSTLVLVVGWFVFLFIFGFFLGLFL